MKNIKIIEIKEVILDENDKKACETRIKTDKTGTLVVNIMSSPGSGKTTFLVKTIRELKDKYKIAVLESDIDGEIDCRTILNEKVDAIQLHTGGECHLTADMVYQGIADFLDKNYDIIFLENIGNLVCPAEFDTGADINVELLSVPEGDDKPTKYPLMFQVANYVFVTKYDTKEYFDFDLDRFKQNVKNINKNIEVIELSSVTGYNFEKWVEILEKEIHKKKTKLF